MTALDTLLAAARTKQSALEAAVTAAGAAAEAAYAAATAQIGTLTASNATLTSNLATANASIAAKQAALDAANAQIAALEVALADCEAGHTGGGGSGLTFGLFDQTDTAAYAAAIGVTTLKVSHTWPGSTGWIKLPATWAPMTSMIAAGTQPVHTQKVRQKPPLGMAETIAGTNDAWLVASAISHEAAALATPEGRLIMGMEAEPDQGYPGTYKRGYTPATFVAMWQHVAPIFRAHAPHVDLMLDYTSNSPGDGVPTRLDAYWPGATHVDLIGFNPYRGTPDQLLSASADMATCVAWANAKGYAGKLISPEFGVIDTNEAKTRLWLEDAFTWFDAHGFTHAIYFNATGGAGDTRLQYPGSKSKLAELCNR